MELITDNGRLEAHLVRCMEDFDELHFATAWASAGTKFFKALTARADRIKRGVVGIHFSQTDPDFMDAFVGSDRVRFVLKASGIFHPKVVLFRSGKEWEAFVGSANLTRGALTKNDEAVVRLTHADVGGLTIRDDLLRTIKKYSTLAETATPEIAARYREDWKRKKALIDRLSGNYGAKDAKHPLKTRSMAMSWREFYTEVAGEGADRLVNRLDVLARSREAFARRIPFNQLGEDERRVISGLPNEVVREWGLFGSMFGAGRFRTVINGRAPEIGAAVDGIPLDGEVTRDDYDAFIERYRAAFPNGRDGIASATRLLAMKRPDQFVCLNKRDRDGIAADYGITGAGGIGYDRYWTEVVGRIRDSAWWNASRPHSGPELDVWRGRVAMMDAIYYEEP